MNNFSRAIVIIFIILGIWYVKDNFFNKNAGIEGVKAPFTNPFAKPSAEEITPEQTPEQKQVSEKEIVKIYFLGTDKSGSKVFKIVKRSVEPNKTKLETAITELLKGVNTNEHKKGFYSEIPKGTKLISLKEDNFKIILNLSSDFQYGGGTDSIFSRIKQIIRTATINSPHKDVYLYLDGKQADVIGGEGIMITQPLSESSFDE